MWEMTAKRLCQCRIRALGFLGILILALCTPAGADIYRYIDSEGTMHFTNTPTHSNYQVYIREAISRTIQPSTRYDRHIAEAVRKYDVPFSLVKAVIKVESDFDPNAVSHAGACGLMQIMPETAEDLGVKNAFDPRENILGGVRYLRALLDRFNGSIPLALAGYNAGPDRVGPLREIPRIEETERYVEKVMEYFRNY